MADKYIVDLKTAAPVETKDGELTKLGMVIANSYATKWVTGFVRDLNLERMYPQLAGLFADIRTDPEYAQSHAIPVE